MRKGKPPPVEEIILKHGDNNVVASFDSTFAELNLMHETLLKTNLSGAILVCEELDLKIPYSSSAYFEMAKDLENYRSKKKKKKKPN